MDLWAVHPVVDVLRVPLTSLLPVTLSTSHLQPPCPRIASYTFVSTACSLSLLQTSHALPAQFTLSGGGCTGLGAVDTG
jgi:hypothetical protein